MDIPLVKDLVDSAKTNYISKLKKEKEIENLGVTIKKRNIIKI